MLEHRDAFMETLRAGPEMRRRIFASLEQRYGVDFGSGAVGRTLYETLHSAVADAAVPGALAEFENRFLPLVDGRRLPLQSEPDPADTDENEAAPAGRRVWSWVGAIVVVVVFVGGVVWGLSILNTMIAKAPRGGKPAATRVQATEPAPPPRPKPANPVRTLEGDEPPAQSEAPGPPPTESMSAPSHEP
jgi:hypothetical protein